MENPKEPFKKLLELINEFSKVSRYKTSIYQLHFYTLIMDNPKIKLRKQFHSQHHQDEQNKFNKSNSTYPQPELEDVCLELLKGPDH